MRIRSFLFVPALAAATLAISVSSASAATLFLSTAHTSRVTIGATATATSAGNVRMTTVNGDVVNTCTHVGLTFSVSENTTARTTLTVIGSHIVLGSCSPHTIATTHNPPWKLTITGEGSVVGPSRAYSATLHNVRYISSTELVTGTLEDLTVTQPTTSTSPICIDADDAGTVSGPMGPANYIDAHFCLTNGWSLT